MLRELLAHRIAPNLVVGASVGAINGAYLAGAPTPDGVARLEAIWRGLRRLLEENLPCQELERASVPLHVVATDLLGGYAVRLSAGPVVDAVLASCAIPAAFPPMRIGERYLMDGAVASNTPIRIAMDLGASRLIVLPTGFACSLESPPRGAIANALHAVNLLIAHQLVTDLER